MERPERFCRRSGHRGISFLYRSHLKIDIYRVYREAAGALPVNRVEIDHSAGLMNRRGHVGDEIQKG
jgi:hypothetical protein